MRRFGLRRKFRRLAPLMNERLRRRWAGCEALAIGRGGIMVVARATDLSRITVRRGVREVQAGPPAAASGCIHTPGSC